MIPAPFDYVRARSIDEAGAILAADEDAKVLAGGMSLIPLLRFRLARPTTLVDIAPLRPDLSYIREDGGAVKIGALTRHHDVATSSLLLERLPLLARAAAVVGDPQVRHRGTIGGAVSHADPAGDLPAALRALDATMVVCGAAGLRKVGVAAFFTGFLETALQPGEIVTEVRVPIPPPRHGWAYTKFTRRAQDWAIVAVAAVVERRDGLVSRARVAIANVAPTPVRATAVESALAGRGVTGIAPAAEAAGEGTSPVSDLAADAEFRRHLARVLTRRTLQEAFDRAEG